MRMVMVDPVMVMNHDDAICISNRHFAVSKVWEEFVREYKRTGQLLVELGSGSSPCHHCRRRNNNDLVTRVIIFTRQI